MGFHNFLEANYDLRPAASLNEVRLCCPLCGDAGYHGYANLNKTYYYRPLKFRGKGFYHCFKCHAGSTSIGFLLRVHRTSPTEAISVLRGDVDLGGYSPQPSLEEFRGTIERLKRGDERYEQDSSPDPITMPLSFRVRSSGTSRSNRRAWAYLKWRLKDKAEFYNKRLKFRYATSDLYAGRIILPVWEGEELVYFQARSFSPETLEPTYRNPTSHTLYSCPLSHKAS